MLLWLPQTTKCEHALERLMCFDNNRFKLVFSLSVFAQPFFISRSFFFLLWSSSSFCCYCCFTIIFLILQIVLSFWSLSEFCWRFFFFILIPFSSSYFHLYSNLLLTVHAFLFLSHKSLSQSSNPSPPPVSYPHNDFNKKNRSLSSLPAPPPPPGPSCYNPQ